ncbi:MAG: hypothetical protein GXX94_05185 [Chloroflexi bacterium]|nr:hypothetical protein [Chloroflexota bacterium]
MPQSFKSLARLIAGLAVVFVIVSASAFQLVNHTNGRMLSAGVEREYHVHIPESYDPATPAALVIALHGYGQLPIQQNDLTHWSDLADEEGFIVVYPGGTYFPLRWQTGGVYEGISDPRSDIAFVSDLIDAMERQYNIDPARIYASGLSNGAGTSFILSCTLSERIAAVGLAAGAYLYPWDVCQPERAVPAIVFHGTADERVPYDGGRAGLFRVQFPSIPRWVDTLAKNNGCDGEPHERQLPAFIAEAHYAGCQADVVFYTIEGGGHVWPGSERNTGVGAGRPHAALDATRTMWAFFQNHPLSAPSIAGRIHRASAHPLARMN